MRNALLLSAAAIVLLALGDGRIVTRAIAQADANAIVDARTFQAVRWRSIGPFRGGRVTAVAGVRTQPNVFYMGATGGGVWKTDNYGATWFPVTDGQIATGSIGAIDVSDSNPNVVYAGTGSEAIRSNVILGRGVYKSSDAGRTWQSVGLRNVGQIGQLKIHPKNPDIAYVAAIGSPFGWGPDRGVYRTKDGGKSWQKVLFINDQTGAVSIAINWTNPNELYAGAWRAQRKPWTIISGGPAAEGGVYKSIDGGDRWTHAGNGFPDDLIGKVWVDIAQSNPKTVYAQVEALGEKGGLYRSADSGATWTLQSSAAQIRVRPFYFNKVFVNPKNENDVWVAALVLSHSTNGGRTWGTLQTPHDDNHGLWFNPDNPRIFVQSNDGGANVTLDGGETWSSQLNQPTAELYMVDADEQFPYRIYGPQQDDGTVVIMNVPDTTKGFVDPSQSWFDASGCESGQIRPTPDGQIIYGDCKGEFGRWNVATGQEQAYWINPEQRYGKNPKEMKFRFVRQAPIEVDPRNPRVVYHGSQFLHKTIDGGIHWTKISPDVTANGPEGHVTSGEPITRDMTGEEVYAALYAIRASRTEPGVIWTGSNDGPVYVTKNGGVTWKNVTPKNLPPGGRVHTIEDSPHRRGSAYVSVYRMYLNDFKPYIYMTNDYGERWTLLTPGTNGIPADQPMHVVREDPEQEGLLYAGTLQGAFVSFDQGTHWQSLQQNLPATPVTDLKVHHGDLIASTMGRSFWVMDDVAPLRQIAAGVMKTSGVAQVFRPASSLIKPFDKSNVFLFTPAATYRTRYPASSGRSDFPEYPPVGARIDYYLADPSGDVSLDILDSLGKVVRRYSSAPRGGVSATMPKRAGMNRLVWDLRYAGTAVNGDDGGFGGGGPMAPPGSYRARLTAEGVTKTETVVVKIDPRVAKDGVTVLDLAELTKFALRVRDLLADVRGVSAAIRTAIDGKTSDRVKLTQLQSRLVTKPGPYEDQMFIDQVSNLARVVGQADQKVPASAYDRFTELSKEWLALKAEADKALK